MSLTPTGKVNPLFSLRSHDMHGIPLTRDDKAFIQSLLLRRLITPREVHERYNLDERTMRRWAQKARAGEAVDVVGRRHLLTDARADELLQWVISHREREHVTPDKAAFTKKAIDMIKKSQEERGDAPTKEEVSETWIDTWLHEHAHHLVHGQRKPVARIRAEHSVRMLATMIALMQLYCYTPPELYLNFDATGLNVIVDDANRLLVTSVAKDSSEPAESDKRADLKFFVKLFPISNAMGEAGPAVFLCEDKSLNDDVVPWKVIPGLGCTSFAGGWGVLAFANDRGGNALFYKKFLRRSLFQ